MTMTRCFRHLPIAALITMTVSPVFGETIIATALPPATMQELARGSITAPIVERPDRERRDREMRSAFTPLGNAISAIMTITPLAALPPAATRGFQATNQAYGPTTEPADASGAVGPKHVVGVFNNAVTVHDRAGSLLSRVTQYQFWLDPSYVPDKIPYDPRVAYDAANDRWVVVMLGDDVDYTKGVLFVAISAGGDPTRTWRRFRLKADPTGLLDIDISQLAITADRIVITANEWNGADKVNTTVFMALKSAAFAGPGLTMTTN